MTEINLGYLIANNSALLPHIEERALEISHHQTVMLQNMLTLPAMTGWAERATSAYLNTGVATELSENTAIPISSLYRHRLSSVTPKEWGSAQELTDRRISSDPENILATVINSLGLSLRRRIEQNAFEASNKFVFNYGASNSKLSLATLLAITSQANHVATAPGNLLFVVHPYQVYSMLEELISISSSVTDKAQEGRAVLSNLSELPNMSNTPLRIPNVGYLTISHNLPRRLVVAMKVHGTGGTFRLQVGEGRDVVPASSPVAGFPYSVTIPIAADATIVVVKAALDALNRGAWTVALNASSLVYTITYPPGLYLHDLYQIQVPVDISAADNVTLDSPAPLSYIQKSKYDKITGTSTHTNPPKDIDGTALGVSFEEVSASAKMLAYKPRALAFDPRTAANLVSETKLDDRVLRYAYYQTFGIVAFDPRMGFTYLTNAKNPL